MSDLITEGVHDYTPDGYVYPEDPVILDRLEWFRDQKLALMVCWGIYTELGMMESWQLSDEDAYWSRTAVEWTDDGEEFKRQYIGLARSFNPVRFLPDRLAALAREGGFRYLIQMTKHHDGFCLWDTKYSDFKTTSPSCAFAGHRYADIVRATLDAFRAQKIPTGLYFSKADWHSPYYWDNCGIGVHTSRNPTYDTAADPERWENFARYTKNQLLELVKNYGRLEMLWLDAGQVCRQNKQDIHIEEIIAEARKIQPWLLSVDRTVGGSCENYLTPECKVPPEPLSVPWETCMPMADGWSYYFDDPNYKSVRQLIHLLLDIVAKGGNLALSVSPAPDGEIPRPTIERMKGIGAWMKANGEGVYGTRPVPPYKADGFVYTQKSGAVYIYKLYGDGSQPLFEKFTVNVPRAEDVRHVTHLSTGASLDFSYIGDGKLEVHMPYGLPRDTIADGIRFGRK